MKNKKLKQATALLIAFVMIFSMCITGTGVFAATSDSSNKTVYLLPESSCAVKICVMPHIFGTEAYILG